MKGPGRFWVLAVILSGMALSMSGCKQLEARDQLNKGCEAYKAGHYDEAIEHFQQATQLDPTLPTAKMYLGKALEQNVVPGLTTPDNLKTANEAMDIFKEVLDQNPNDVNSMKEIAGIYFSIKDLDNAEYLAEEGSCRRSQRCRGRLYRRRDRLDQGAPEQADRVAVRRPERRWQGQHEGAQERDGAPGAAECAAHRRRPQVPDHGRQRIAPTSTTPCST